MPTLSTAVTDDGGRRAERAPGAPIPAGRARLPRSLLAVALLALAIQSGLAIGRGSSPRLDGNEEAYLQVAQNLLAGRGLKTDLGERPTAIWGSIHPLALAAVLRATGGSLRAVLLWNGLLMAATVLLSGLCCREAFGPRAGLMAAALAAVYPYFLYFGPTALSEPPALALLLGAILSTLTLPQRASLARLALAGLLFGLASLARSPCFFFIPFVVGWLWLERPDLGRLRAAAVIGLSVAAVLAPWTYRNWRLFGGFLPLDSKAGYNLYFGLHPAHDAPWSELDFRGDVPMPVVTDELAWNRELTLAALRFATEDPMRTLRYASRKVIHVWSPFATSYTTGSARWLKPLSMLPITLLAVVGVVMRPPWRGAPLLLFLLFASVFAMHLIVFGGPRTRLAADPVLIAFAAAAVDRLLARWGWRARASTAVP